MSVAGKAGPVIPDGWRTWFDARRRQVDDALADHFRREILETPPHSHLLAAVEYSVTGCGKRLRPVLVLESCTVCGGEDSAAMSAALAVECVHAFSLIHDDLPAMDDDDLRRGKPTSHKVYGEATAILAGDWLLGQAFRLISSDRENDVATAIVGALAEGTLAMIEGQAADIEGEGASPDGALVDYVHEHKTARLLEACCRMGALSARAPETSVKALARYGRHLGIAFQIADDILDCSADTETLGKRAGKDAAAGKQTYPAAFGLEASRVRAGDEVAAAVAALEPFGERAERLRLLSDYVITRDH